MNQRTPEQDFIRDAFLPLCLLLLLLLVALSCGNSPTKLREAENRLEIKAGIILSHVPVETKMKLRRIQWDVQKESNFSGSYSSFFFVSGGHVSGGESQETYLNFSWQTPKGYYVFSKVPMGKVRVVLVDEDASISFAYDAKRCYYSTSTNCHSINSPSWEFAKFAADMMLDRNLTDENAIIDFFDPHLTVYCRESDWPMSIKFGQDNEANL